MIPILIFLAPFLAALLTPLLQKKAAWAQHLASIALTLSLSASIAGLVRTHGGKAIIHHMGGWQPPFGIEWRLDALSALLCILVSVISLLVVFSTGPNVRLELKKGQIPFYTTVLLNVAGLFGILLTHDLFNLFVFLEVSSLTTYALVATGDRKRGNLASLRYLLIGTVGASFYLLGVGYLYSAAGTLNMSDMATHLPVLMGSRSVTLGLFLIFIGLAIKMGLFPFHGWLPDAYTYASNPASSLLAPLATKVSIYVFIRIFYTLLGHDQFAALGFTKILIVFGVLAMIVGSLLALVQKEFKRMLAYSSISHIGLIAVGLGINEKIAFVGVILHIIHHAVMKATLFLIATSVYEKHGITDILDFEKLRKKMPNTLRALAIAALSMIGIPPLCGFFSKWYIVVGAFKAHHEIVAFIIILSSLLTALYFFKLIERAFFFNLSLPSEEPSEGRPVLLATYGFLSISLIVLGLLAPFIFNWGMQILTPMMR